MDLSHLAAWGGFLALVLALLMLDLLVLHRKPHEIKMREALIGASIPVLFALTFTIAIFYLYENHLFHLGVVPAGTAQRDMMYWPKTGSEAVMMYLTGYVIEISLSADNVFLFVVLMNFFKVPKIFQHRVLFWGVLGALVMRAAMILAGTALIQRFDWIILVFGGFLLYAGLKMMFSSSEEADPGKSVAVRLARRFIPITPGFHGKKFFVRLPRDAADAPGATASEGSVLSHAGPMGLFATPLFLVLICVEVTDVIFAVDSIPAIFAVTFDPFIVFTSNVFAILGLRSMYFLLAGVMDKFTYLRYGLAVVLAFVGIKMLTPWAGRLFGNWRSGQEYDWHIPTEISLTVIVVCLLASIVASLAFAPEAKLEETAEVHDEDDKHDEVP